MAIDSVDKYGRDAPPSGLILLNKRPGLTSFDSLAEIKRAIHSGKAGHTGTLDKFAEGLMIVLTGKALKLSKLFTHVDKQYNGTIRFGIETDTLDPEGANIAEAPLPSRGDVERALAMFAGKIEQAPPEYSAIHIDGQRASQLARQGKAPEMKKRPVEIMRLELTFWDPPFAGIAVHCSSGTYIRSLARDIAIEAGSRAHLTSLKRTRIAGFRIEDAVCEIGELASFLRPIDRSVFAAIGIPCIETTSAGAREITGGKPLREWAGVKELSVLSDAVSAAAIFCGDALLAIVERAPAPIAHSMTAWKFGYVYSRD